MNILLLALLALPTRHPDLAPQPRDLVAAINPHYDGGGSFLPLSGGTLTGALTVTGDICVSTATGPCLENAASSTTNPPIYPDKASPTAGIGGTGGDVDIITNGVQRLNVDTAGVMTAVSQITATGGLRIPNGVQAAAPRLTFGTSDDILLQFDTALTPDAFKLGLNSASRAFYIYDNTSGFNIDWALAQQTNPNLVIQSASTTVTLRMRLYHDQTNGVIDVDSGVVSIPDGMTSAGTIISTRATDIGWTPASSANQACNTTCTSACVVGFDTVAGNVVGLPLLCTDATADTCLCAGP